MSFFRKLRRLESALLNVIESALIECDCISLIAVFDPGASVLGSGRCFGDGKMRTKTLQSRMQITIDAAVVCASIKTVIAEALGKMGLPV